MDRKAMQRGVKSPQQHGTRHLLRFKCRLGSLPSLGTWQRERGRESERVRKGLNTVVTLSSNLFHFSPGIITVHNSSSTTVLSPPFLHISFPDLLKP